MNTVMKIGKLEVGKGHPVFIVAEAGINHNGNIETAKEIGRAHV